MIAIIRYGATWLRAFRETGDAHSASLIASLQAQYKLQEQTIARLVTRLEHSEEHYRNCENLNIELRRRVEELERQLDNGGHA